MKHEIIKTENYLLVLDDSKIKDGDWCIYKTGEIIQYLVKLNTDNLKKIIAHLPLNNSPILQGVDLLPPLEQEDGVEELAPKMPIGFECEMEQYVIQQSMPKNVVGYRCKTTTNPQGQTQRVGKYIY